MISKAPWDENGKIIREIKDKECTVEGYLRDEVKKNGGKAYKFVSPGNNGVPDRLIVFPGNIVLFVETKQKGKKSTPQQRNRQNEFRAFGCKVYADIDTKEKVDAIIREVMGQ